MRNITALKAEFTAKTIEGRIKGLVQELYKLAPHPAHSAQRGPLFISLNSAFKPAAEYDGMLGSLMLESFIGAAFADAAGTANAANDNGGTSSAINAMGSANLDIFAEALSEYVEAEEDKGRGKGTFALGEHKSICNQFNVECDAELRAYVRDLDMRVKIESTIARLSAELCALNSHEAQAALQLCA